MQLDQITANIRLRNPWEAIDLGLALIRHSWREIYLPWFIFLSILSTILFLITPEEYRQYSLFAVWWLKPLSDRFLLNMISKQLFNEHLTTTDALLATPGLIKKTGLFGGLTFRRPSFSRGFNLPIWQLEGLRGKARSQRQHVLLQTAHSHAIGVTIAMIFIELTLYFSLYALIIFFVPESFQGTALDLIINGETDEDISIWLHALDHLIYTLSVFVIEPFFVAASFTLYINRRTQLEAWDIELVFRQLAKRLENLGNKLPGITLVPVLLLVLSTASFNPLYAESAHVPGEISPGTLSTQSPAETTGENTRASQPEHLSDKRLPADDSARIIKKIMQRPELSNKKTVKKWVPLVKEEEKSKEDSEDSRWSISNLLKPLVKLFSVLFESSLWAALGIAIVALFISRHQWLPLFRPNKNGSTDYEAPEVMFGMDIRPQSLPENIPETARQLWLNNKHRESLSLLYRGALAHLLANEYLLLKASQTEGDILKLATKNLPVSQHVYFSQLTEQWRQIAYAHHLPSKKTINQLFDRWYLDFISPSSTKSDIKSDIIKSTKRKKNIGTDDAK